MRLAPLLSIAAVAALAAGVAAAQTDQSAATAGQASAPAAASIPPGGVTSSPTAPDEAFKLKAGDPTVISNAPVPDTPANRKAFGGPMSNAGRHTKPIGD